MRMLYGVCGDGFGHSSRAMVVGRYLEELKACKAIIATAGFTLMSEALYLKKPYLALPLKGQFEQVLPAMRIRYDLGDARQQRMALFQPFEQDEVGLLQAIDVLQEPCFFKARGLEGLPHKMGDWIMLHRNICSNAQFVVQNRVICSFTCAFRPLQALERMRLLWGAKKRRNQLPN